MALTSLKFALFAAVTVLIYFLPPMRRHQWKVLLAASYFFYLYNSRWLTGFLLFTTALIYGAAMRIYTLEQARAGAEQEPEDTATGAAIERKKKAILAGTLLVNFGLLFALKYFNLFHLGLIPLGISFYTFQATGYLIDVYRGQAVPEKNPAKFALFLSFFPQIIQGPIAEFGQLHGQLIAEHRPEWMRFKLGCELILWGLFKKLVIADRAVKVINAVSADYKAYSGSMILFTMLLYAFQIYADFSGGIDMARGVAEILGIDMAVNFRQPYFARSLAEYWQRWHISLGAWMKKYVFYTLAMSQTFKNVGRKIRKSPLGKKPIGKHLSKTLAPSFASFIVFMLVGIWHGSNTRYLGFGLWNGLIIMFSTLLEPVFKGWNTKLHINVDNPAFRLWQMLRTFVLVLIGYYFDIAPSFIGAFRMMGLSVTDWRLGGLIEELRIGGGMRMGDYAVLALGLLIVLFMSIRMERAGVDNPGELVSRHGKVLQWVAIYAMLLLVFVFGIYGPGYDPAVFAYMQF